MLACVTTHELENKQNRCAVCVDLLTCSQSSRQLADVYRALLAKLLQDFSSTQDGSIDFGVNLSMQQISRLKQVGIYNSLLLQQRLCNTDCKRQSVLQLRLPDAVSRHQACSTCVSSCTRSHVPVVLDLVACCIW